MRRDTLTTVAHSEWNIRPPKPGDVDRLAALNCELGYPVTPAVFAERLAVLDGDPHHAVFVAERPGEAPAGYVHIHHRRRIVAESSAELGALIVAPSARRSGAGRALFRAAAEWSRTRGLGTLRIRSGPTRAEAHGFYASCGCRHLKDQHILEYDLTAPDTP
jgi:GNAT superfamily N-acetyltransferase